MEEAHDGMVWDLSWHPLGHMLVSGSNDRSTYVLVFFCWLNENTIFKSNLIIRRFWTRNRPGDTVDKNDDSSTPKAERATGIIFKNIELPGNFFLFSILY